MYGSWYWRYQWHDGQQVIEEETPGIMPADRFYAYGVLIDEVISEWHSMNGGWWRQWYQTDALGSVYVLTDNDGNVVEAYHYSIYGSPKVYAPDGTPRALTNYDNRILFTGREYLWQLALYYYRFRWYCPKAGRFISPEPFSNYTYSGSCPTNWLDPTGLRRVCKNIVVTLTVSDRYFGAKQVPPLVKKYRFCAEFVNCGENERVYEAFWLAAERIARAYLRFSEENLHLMDGPRPYMLTKAQMQRMRNLWGENVVGWVLAVYGKLQALMGKLTGEPPIKIVCCLGKEDPEAAARGRIRGRTVWLYRGWDYIWVPLPTGGRKAFLGVTGEAGLVASIHQLMRTQVLLHEMMHLVGAVDWVYMWRVFVRTGGWVPPFYLGETYRLEAAAPVLKAWIQSIRITSALEKVFAGAMGRTVAQVAEQTLVSAELWRWARRLDRLNADTLAWSVLSF